ncbi:MAG TPA: hypothetical protein VF992_01905 [Thermoplasmata archaeon]
MLCVLLANLPTDVVRILPWAKVTNGATGAAPDGMPGFVNVLVQLGQMFYDGLVALGTFLVNLAEAIVDWGMKALGAVWNTVVAVAQAATTVLNQFASWVLDFIRQVLQAAVDVFLRPILDMMNTWASQVASGFSRVLLAYAITGSPSHAEAADLANVLLRGPFPNLIIALAGAFVVAMSVIGFIAIATPAGAVVAVVQGVLKGIVRTAILNWVITTIVLSAATGWMLAEIAGTGALPGEILASIEVVWNAIMVVYALIAEVPFKDFIVDVVALMLNLLGALMVFVIGPVAASLGAAVPVAVAGTALSYIGLMLALGGKDFGPGWFGQVDEFLEAATLGFDAAQTGIAVGQCLAGRGC